MKIPVVGFDPSLTHWGISRGILDLSTGYLEDVHLEVLEPMDLTGKQLRVNSRDLYKAEQLSKPVIETARWAKAVFTEVPVGSQSSRAQTSYGICVGILGCIRALGITVIEVSATEVKLALAGSKSATKTQMIEAGLRHYPNANWPRYEKNGKGFSKGDIHSKAEHVADGLGAIHAGVLTPTFQTLMRLFEGTK